MSTPSGASGADPGAVETDPADAAEQAVDAVPDEVPTDDEPGEGAVGDGVVGAGPTAGGASSGVDAMADLPMEADPADALEQATALGPDDEERR